MGQDATDEELADLDAVLSQGIAYLEKIELAQADPDSPKIGKVRTPETDGSTSSEIKNPYPFEIEEWVDLIAKIAGGVKSRAGNKITLGNGSVIELPTTDRGPQQIESGDNPDSYSSQDVGALEKEVVAAFEPLYEKMNALTARDEQRQVQQAAAEFISALPSAPVQSGARVLLQNVKTFEEFEGEKDRIIKMAQSVNGKGRWEGLAKGIGFTGLAQDTPVSPSGRLPENPSEMCEYLVQACVEKYDLDTVLAPRAMGEAKTVSELKQDTTEAEDIIDPTTGVTIAYTPRNALRKFLQDECIRHPRAAMQYTNLLRYGERGLTQAVPEGANEASAIATGQPFVFPLISRVFPALLLTRLGAVYPIDRPDARLFYWNDIIEDITEDEENYTYQIGCYDMDLTNSPGEFEEANRLSLELLDVPLSVSEYKLAAEWSMEMENKLLAYQNRDPLGEYITKMADAIARERNRAALVAMMAASADRNINYGTVRPSSAWLQPDWNDQLHASVQRASSLIFNRRYREASYVVADAQSCDRLMRGMKSGTFQETRDTWNFAHGLSVVGQPQNFYTLIKCAYFREFTDLERGTLTNKLLVVARGETFSDAGIVYAPFTYNVVPLLIHPTTFKKQVGVIEQSAMKVVIPEMFARVTVKVGETGSDW